jgi:putative selenate reductase molybdopterin-binding subunit
MFKGLKSLCIVATPRSIHAADAGTVINPMRCRGQIEDGVAQAIGTALYAELTIDGSGKVASPDLRSYHIPTFAGTPFTEVHFANTFDRIWPPSGPNP